MEVVKEEFHIDLPMPAERTADTCPLVSSIVISEVARNDGNLHNIVLLDTVFHCFIYCSQSCFIVVIANFLLAILACFAMSRWPGDNR